MQLKKQKSYTARFFCLGAVLLAAVLFSIVSGRFHLSLTELAHLIAGRGDVPKGAQQVFF